MLISHSEGQSMIEQLELTPQNTIRLETAFSRFPVHKLARRGNINIEIMETTPTGEIKTKWGVDYPEESGAAEAAGLQGGHACRQPTH